MGLHVSDHGPCAVRQSLQRYIVQCAESKDPQFFAIVDRISRKVTGYVSLPRIDPANSVIQIENVMFTKGIRQGLCRRGDNNHWAFLRRGNVLGGCEQEAANLRWPLEPSPRSLSAMTMRYGGIRTKFH
ncbi:hypothetical protein V1525DRAFT_413719 [Lipomyces kononenkoae]|uniref:Uncharacterized protein n=1 Tax=Lipomyces kononenkoae TaxID=34357 RepID=A0ACC3SRJ4_LIPKO